MKNSALKNIFSGLLIQVVAAGCTSNQSTSRESTESRLTYSDAVIKTVPSSNFVLTLSATVASPVVGGSTLTADDIFVDSSSAYISYNLPGAVHMGGFDEINMTIPATPVLKATTTFANSTVNGLYESNGNVYVVGSTTSATTSGWPAFISELSLSSGVFNPVISFASLLDTYAGTGVTSWNGSLYALSGANGSSTSQGLSVLNPTSLAQTASVSLPDARGLSFYPGGGTDLFVISGGGNLYDISTSNTVAHTIALGGNSISQSKSSLQVGKTMVVASKGDQGVAIVCQADQQILATLAAVTVNGLSSTLTVSNGVAAGPGLLFVANGEAGIYVYVMTVGVPSGSVCDSVTLQYVGTINLGSTTYSANTIRYVNGSLFVATGLGGFKIVTVTVLSPILNANDDFI